MTDPTRSLASVITTARALLEDEAAMGGIGIPVVRPVPAPSRDDAGVGAVRVAVSSQEPRVVAPGGATQAPVVHAANVTDRAGRLHLLAEKAAACTACGLHTSRTKSVFARGSHNAELVFVGEGPGRDEDVSGLPFVGAAGKLLDKMVAAMGYGRDDVYICNVVKCRPPENRTPLPNEAAACEPFLTAQLDAVAPKVIVALGKCAAINLGVAEETGRWRGVWKQWHGIPVMPTFHPAYLLRSPEKKREVWEDLQLVMARLGRTPPSKGQVG